MTPSQFTTINRIITLICIRYDVTPTQLESEDRRQSLVWPRWLAIHLARHYTALDDQCLALIFNRTRSAIYSALRSVATELELSPSHAREVAALQSLFERAQRLPPIHPS